MSGTLTFTYEQKTGGKRARCRTRALAGLFVSRAARLRRHFKTLTSRRRRRFLPLRVPPGLAVAPSFLSIALSARRLCGLELKLAALAAPQVSSGRDSPPAVSTMSSSV
jgi:hypothetical protein